MASADLGGVALATTLTSLQRNLRMRGFWWWPDEPESQGLEVLHDGGEMELVASAGEASKPQPLEAVVGLQVCEAHLDALCARRAI